MKDDATHSTMSGAYHTRTHTHTHTRTHTHLYDSSSVKAQSISCLTFEVGYGTIVLWGNVVNFIIVVFHWSSSCLDLLLLRGLGEGLGAGWLHLLTLRRGDTRRGPQLPHPT